MYFVGRTNILAVLALPFIRCVASGKLLASLGSIPNLGQQWESLCPVPEEQLVFGKGDINCPPSSRSRERADGPGTAEVFRKGNQSL